MGDRTDNRNSGHTYWHGCGMVDMRSRARSDGSSIKWHKDRLPKEEDTNEWGEVLATTEPGWVEIAKWTGSEFMINGQYVSTGYVKAWAKMPEPYRGDKE